MLQTFLAYFSTRRLLRLVRAECQSLRDERTALLSQLEAERVRHREREEALLDRCLLAAQQHPLPKLARTPQEQSALPVVKPQRILTDFEREEREAWGSFAEEAGRLRQDGYLKWEQTHLSH